MKLDKLGRLFWWFPFRPVRSLFEMLLWQVFMGVCRALREHGVVPHRIVQAQTQKPAKQQVLIDLLNQQPLRTNRVKHLQQKRP